MESVGNISNTAGRTRGGRTANPPRRGPQATKKPSFQRDNRLARDGARMFTGPLRPPAMSTISSNANTATSAAITYNTTAAPIRTTAVAAAVCPFSSAISTTTTSIALYQSDNSTNDSDYDDNSVEVVDGSPRPVGNKGKIPFSCLPGDVQRIMQDKLNANSSKANVDSSSVDTLRTIFKSIVENRAYLLELAKEVDVTMVIQCDGEEVTIHDLLANKIPVFFANKTTKSKVCELMVGVWSVLQGIVSNATIRRGATHELQAYLSLMGRVESTARRIISEADKADRNGKSIKLSSLEMNRMFLADRGTRPTLRFTSCAMCGHGIVDEPYCNKESARQNKLIDVKWAADRNQIDEFVKTGCNPLLDKNGAVVTKIGKNPLYRDEILVCHCWQNRQDSFTGGSKCVLNCYDSKTKRQYPSGKCPVCLCGCSFVCSKV